MSFENLDIGPALRSLPPRGRFREARSVGRSGASVVRIAATVLPRVAMFGVAAAFACLLVRVRFSAPASLLVPRTAASSTTFRSTADAVCGIFKPTHR